MEINLGPIILSFIVVYGGLALLAVSSLSVGLWGAFKYIKNVITKRREDNEEGRNNFRINTHLKPSATMVN